MKRARKYYENDDFSAAIEQYQKLIDTYKDDDDTAMLGIAEAHYLIGQINLENQGRDELAEERFLKAIAHYPDYYDALLSLGKIYIERDDYEKIEEYLIRAVKVSPQIAEARKHLADVLWTQGMRMRNDMRALVTEGDSESAIKLQKKMAEKFQAAIMHREGLVRLEQNYQNFFDLAESYKEIGDWNKALNPYGEAFKRNPYELAVGEGFMEALMRNRMLDMALEVAERTGKYFPNESESYLFKGRIRMILGENEKALEELRRAYALADAAEKLTISYDLVRVEMALNHPDTAIKMLEKIQEEYSDEDDVLMLLTDFYMSRGKATEALEQLDKFIKRNPLNLEVKVQRGYLLVMKGKVEEGIGLLEEMGQKQPRMLGIQLTLARIYAERNEIDQVFEQLNLAVDKGFKDYMFFFNVEAFEKVLQDKRFIQLIRKIQERTGQSLVRSLIENEKTPASEEELVISPEDLALPEAE